MKSGYYVTTPIYYISGNPHIGHAYTTVVADVLARTARTRGDAFFLTGVDEHGQKVARAAEKAGMTPQAWCDALVPKWEALFKLYNVEYSDFLRTTQPRHERVVQAVFEKLRENGEIYLGKYEGWYCVDDESFWLESKLIDGKCPECGREVQFISEDNWFFRLSKYTDRLIEYFRNNPNFVGPRPVYNEMMALLQSGLEDFSITRSAISWGIPTPEGDGVIYVWFDALLNYISALNWTDLPCHPERSVPDAQLRDREDQDLFHKYWPASVQLIGKEIARFHTIIWPAVLWAIGEEAPQCVFAHGWITIDGQKMGKSLGNSVDPFVLAEKFGADSMRYFLLREAPFGNDFSYSEEKIAQRHNNDLGNDFGNLVRRSLSMLQKYRESVVPHTQAGKESPFASRFADLSQRVYDKILALEFRDALEATWELVSALNRAIDEQKPWVLFKEARHPELDALLYDLCEGIRWLAVLLAPMMPERAREIWRQLGLEGTANIEENWTTSLVWGKLASGIRTLPGDALFPRLDIETEPE